MNYTVRQGKNNELLQLAILKEKYYHGQVLDESKNWDYYKERKAVHNKYRGR